MIKALLEKQTLEFLSMFTGGGKSGKAKNKKMDLLYLIVFAYAFIVVGYMMYTMADNLCPALVATGMEWLFFALFGLMSMGLSVIFGIFTTQPMLYDAKDNEFLLALPIPASKILFSRMALLYGQNLLCSLLIFIPSLIAYSQTVGVKPLSLVFQVVIILVLSLLSLVVECIVGWIVALVSSKMRKKNLITLVLSLVLLAGYFYLTIKMPEYMEYIIANSQQVGTNLINAFYPFYQMGLGASGQIKGFLIFTGISLVLFAVVYFLLSISFIKIITNKRGVKKVKYTGQVLEIRSYSSALFRKELTRFFSSTMYMLNCGLGVIFHIAIAVLAIVKKDIIIEIFSMVPAFADNTTAVVTALVCVIAAMNMVTAASVSLEGKNIWILQTAPFDSWQVIKAKLKLHLVINLPSSVLCIAVLGVVMDIGVSGIILSEILAVIFVFLCAVTGLVFNLKMPSLNWTSEAVVIKQSASVLVTMLVNMGSVFALGGLYYLLQKALSWEMIFLIFIAVLAIVTVILTLNLKNKGSKKFMYL